MLRELEPEDPETERLLRNSFRWQWLTFALLLSAAVFLFVLPRDHTHPKAVLFLVAAAFAAAVYTGSKVRNANRVATSRYYLDTRYGRWRFSLVNMLIFGLIGVHYLTQFSLSHDSFTFAVGIFLLLLPPANLVTGPKAEFEEDITRVLRGRAMRVGYVSALLALAAVTAVSAYRPAELMTALAWGLFAASAVPIVLYVVLDWWSDRSTNG